MNLNTLNFKYVGSRIFAVGYKPLILSFLSLVDDKSTLNDMSVIFLFSTICLFASSFSTHRELYLVKFNENLNPNVDYQNNLISNYLSSLIVIILLITVTIFLLPHFSDLSFFLTIPMLLIFIIEKIYDEIQRYEIVRKEFISWSKITSIKISIFLFTFIISYFFFSNVILSWSILSFSILTIFCYFFFKKKFDNYNKINFQFLFGLKYLINHYKFLFITLLPSMIVYLDRLITYFISAIDIGYVSICSMIFSILPMITSFFFISEKRYEIVANKFSALDFFKEKKFYLFLMFGYIFSILISIIFFEYEIIQLNYEMIILISFVQLLNALGLLFTEYHFWRKNYFIIFFIDTFFWLILIFMFLINHSNQLEMIFVYVNLILFFRLILYVACGKMIKNK